MEAALRERRIRRAYLQAAEQGIHDLVRLPSYTVDTLIHAHEIFVRQLHHWEQSQHCYERLISDDALTAECVSAFNIRSKYANFNLDVENLITSLSLTNPFANIRPRNDSVSSEEGNTLNTTVASTVTGPVPVNLNNEQNIVDRNVRNVDFVPGSNSTPYIHNAIANNVLHNVTNAPLANSSSHNISHIPSVFNLPIVNNNVPISSVPVVTSNAPMVNSNVANSSTPMVNFNLQNPSFNSNAQNSNVPNTNFPLFNSNAQNFIVPNFNTPMVNFTLPNSNPMVSSNVPISNQPISNQQSNVPIANQQSNMSISNQSVNSSVNNVHNITSQNANSNVTSPLSKLDKVKLKKFFGQVEEWQSFWEIFRSLVHDTNLPTITKFTYLVNSLRGEAAKSIEGFSIIEANYESAVKLLTKRFGRTDLIIQTHIQALLLDVSVVPYSSDLTKYIASLWNFNDTITAHIRSLEALGIQGDVVQFFLCPIILSKLPEKMRIDWFKSKRLSGNLPVLLEFIDSYITTLSQTNILTRGAASVRPKEKQNSSALYTNVKTEKCLHCKKDHNIETCREFLALSVSDRITRVKLLKTCMRCLTRNHVYANCKSNCRTCTKKHHHLLCLGNSGAKNNNAGTNPNVTGEKPNAKINAKSGEKSNAQSGEKPKLNVNAPTFTTPNSALVQHCGSKITVLQTAKCSLINDSNKYISVNILFDSGSDRTYITSDMAKECELKPINSEEIIFNSFGTTKSSKPENKKVYNLKLLGSSQTYDVKAIEMDTICRPLYRQKIPSDIIEEFKLSNVMLADDYSMDRHIKVDILIGLDNLYELINPIVSIQHNTLVAHESVFGWIFSGSFSPSTHTRVLNVTTQMCCFSVNSGLIKKFWELEVMGVSSKETLHCLETSDVMSKFRDEVKFENGRYIVNLLWKPQEVTLVNNFPIALKRFESLERFLSTKPKLYSEYFQVFEGYKTEGKIEEVPKDEIIQPKREPFYIPHFPVIKDRSVSTRIRPVFDGSAKSFNNISLNNALDVGPPLHANILAILIRFRRWLVAIFSDIKSAFHAIGLTQNDRDVCRFLLRDSEGTLKHMRFTVVPFGLSCSPFLLNAVIKFHLSKYPMCNTIKELLDNTYVDDFMSGCDSIEMATEMVDTAKNVMSQGGFCLTKWNTNNSEIDKIIQIASSEYSSILGISFNIVRDSFLFEGYDLSVLETELTKRVILSIVYKLFDPLGVLSPYIMYARFILQDLWRMGMDWDQVPPQSLIHKFSKWLDSSKSLKNFELPRIYFPDIGWSRIKCIEIHGFSDASCKGFGAVTYLRIKTSDGFAVAFGIAKSRVAPVAGLSLPRLELMGCLLNCRLVDFFITALDLDHSDIQYSTHYWTDSTVCLHWLRSDPFLLQMFVSNRVTAIQKLSNPANWYHVRGSENPADIISRGCLVDDLINNPMWLKGPSFLYSNVKFENVSSFSFGERDLAIVNEERKANSLVCLVTSHLEFNMARFSSLSIIKNIMSHILRFIFNCKNNDVRMTGPFSSQELKDAEMRIVYLEQRNHFSNELEALRAQRSISSRSNILSLRPFLDENGLLRIRTGRVDNNLILPYETKFPLLVPAGHIAELLIRNEHQFLRHSGPYHILNSLRSKYWILEGKRLASKVHRECPRCSRYDSRPIAQPSPAMPSFRVNQAPPFTITGLDNCGPIFCSENSSHKFYVLLCTCAVTRAVHLELVDSLDVDDCLLALRRFAARRGMPSAYYSDNAKNFEGAKRHIHHIYGTHSPVWHFIPPVSPWWGGWWERMVKSVKLCLRKTLNGAILSKCETETLLIEIEACVNSRPLTYLSNNPLDPQALTPSHFLLGKSAGEQTTVTFDGLPISMQDLQVAYSVRLGTLKTFWNRWLIEYISNLPPIVNKTNKVQDICLGELVLIRQENIRRVYWPLGRIVNIFPGRDGVIRAVEIKMTDNTILKRSVQMLHRLETFEADNHVVDDDIDNTIESEPHNDSYHLRDVIEQDAGAVDPLPSDPDSGLPPDILVQSPDNVSDNLIDNTNDDSPVNPNTRATRKTRRGREIRAPKKLDL